MIDSQAQERWRDCSITSEVPYRVWVNDNKALQTSRIHVHFSNAVVGSYERTHPVIHLITPIHVLLIDIMKMNRQ